MKTFQEFQYQCNLIFEKYYEPNEKLPSGKTPVDKAKKKGVSGDKLRKVERGADNKEVDTRPQKGLDVTYYKSIKTTSIKHPESGVVYDIEHKGDLEGKPHYDISWWGTKEGSKTPKDKLKLARTAKDVWHKNVQPTLPHGSVVSNTPASPSHEKLYKRAGFGPAHQSSNLNDYYNDDRYGRQYATVGRNPSPKQQAKGKKTRLKPRNPPIEKQPLRF